MPFAAQLVIRVGADVEQAKSGLGEVEQGINRVKAAAGEGGPNIAASFISAFNNIVREAATVYRAIALIGIGFQALEGVGNVLLAPFKLIGAAVEGVIDIAGQIGAAFVDAFGKAALAAGALGVAIVGVIGYASDLAAKYEQALTHTSALTYDNVKNIQQFGEAILALGPAIGRTPQELAEGLYTVSSNTNDAVGAMALLKTAGIDAAIGLGTTEQSARALMSIIEAYKLDLTDANRISDMFIATVAAGNAPIGSFVNSIGRVLPIAAAVGIGFDQIGASWAQMTRIGLNATEATTALRGAIQALEAPAAQTREAFKEMGVTAEEVRASIADKGLLQTFDDLYQKTGGNMDLLKALIPNVRALTGVLADVSSGSETYAQVLDQVRNSQGMTNEAFKLTAETAAFQKDRLDAAFQAIGISAGMQFDGIVVPALKNAADAMVALEPIAQSMAQGIVRGVTEVQTAFVGMLGTLDAPIEQKIGEAFAWGINIAASLAEGIAAGVEFVATAIVGIAGAIGFWLAPGSAPRALPDVPAWGANITNMLLDGMLTKADFSVLKQLSSLIEEEIRNTGISGDALYNAVMGSREAVVAGFHDLATGAGDATSAFQRLNEIAEPLGLNLSEQVQVYADLARVSGDLAESTARLRDLKREEKEATAPYNQQLDKLRLQAEGLRLDREAARIAAETGKAANQRPEQLALLANQRAQLALEKEINAIKLKSFDDIAKEQDVNEKLKDQKDTLSDQVAAFKTLADMQKENIALWNETHKAAAGGGGGGKGAIGAGGGIDPVAIAKRIKDALGGGNEPEEAGQTAADKFIKGITDSFDKKKGQAQERISAAWTQMVSSVMTLPQRISEAFSGGGTGGMGLDLAMIFVAAIPSLDKGVKLITDALKDKNVFVNWIQEMAPKVGLEISNLWKVIISWWEAEGHNAWDAIKTAGEALWKWIEPMIPLAVGELVKFMAKIVDWITTDGATKLGEMTGKLTPIVYQFIIDAVPLMLVELGKFILSFTKGMADGLASGDWIPVQTALHNAMTQALTNAIGTLISLSVPGQIARLLAALSGKIAEDTAKLTAPAYAADKAAQARADAEAAKAAAGAANPSGIYAPEVYPVPGGQFGASAIAGRPMWVGEMGRELFIPGGSGRIVSHSASEGRSGGRGGGVQVHGNVTVQAVYPGLSQMNDFEREKHADDLTAMILERLVMATEGSA